jgi:hypothetical protein
VEYVQKKQMFARIHVRSLSVSSMGVLSVVDVMHVSVDMSRVLLWKTKMSVNTRRNAQHLPCGSIRCRTNIAVALQQGGANGLVTFSLRAWNQRCELAQTCNGLRL